MGKMVKRVSQAVKARLNAIKEDFTRNHVFSAEELVENMSGKTFHPFGKPHWKIADKILADKNLQADQKLNLLFDMYGKYYIYQHEKATRFAVYENYYEKIMFYDLRGMLRRDNQQYQEFFNLISAEQNYLINRRIGDSIKEIFGQINSTPGAVEQVIQGLDPAGVNLLDCMYLPNNYSERNINGTFYPTIEERKLTETLVSRYKVRHPEEFLETKELPEGDAMLERI